MLQVEVYDLRKLDQSLRIENSNLSYNLRCIRCLKEEEGIISLLLLSRLCSGLYRRQSERTLLAGNSRVFLKIIQA